MNKIISSDLATIEANEEKQEITITLKSKFTKETTFAIISDMCAGLKKDQLDIADEYDFVIKRTKN